MSIIRLIISIYENNGQMMLFTVSDKFSCVWGKCWRCSVQNCSHCSAVIHIPKFHLFSFIKENVSSQLYVYAKTKSIFLPKSVKWKYFKSQNSPQRSP